MRLRHTHVAVDVHPQLPCPLLFDLPVFSMALSQEPPSLPTFEIRRLYKLKLQQVNLGTSCKQGCHIECQHWNSMQEGEGKWPRVTGGATIIGKFVTRHFRLLSDSMSTSINLRLPNMAQRGWWFSRTTNWCSWPGSIRNSKSTGKHSNSERRRNTECQIDRLSYTGTIEKNADRYDEHVPDEPVNKWFDEAD